MRTLNDITTAEIYELYYVLGLDREESENRYPHLYKSDGRRIEWDDDILIVDNNNDWGFLYFIHPNGAIITYCKDDNSERSGDIEIQPIIKFLYGIGIDLWDIKSFLNN